MIIVVDANILFSAIITPNGKIAKLLGNSALGLTRLSCHFLITELHRHEAKIIKASKRSEISVRNDMYGYLRHIRIYDETFLDRVHLKEAKRLTEKVDLYDMDYVALHYKQAEYCGRAIRN